MNFHEFLQTAPELAGLTHDDKATLEQSMVVNDYPDGFEFFKENKPGDAIYLILKGEVAVTHEQGIDRGMIQLARLGGGEWFGLVSLIAGGRHEASCKAVGPVQAASLPRAAFMLLYEANVPIALHFQHIVARQLTRDYRAIAELLHQVMFAKTRDEAQDAFDKVITRYHGPERRRPDSTVPPAPTST
jgi:CRP-like cAMP-binding protein